MPLKKLQLKPGINREGTTLSNEGGWFACDKVRFRSGYPEKIGGWQRDAGATLAQAPTTGVFWGVARSLWCWVNLVGYNLLAIGTHRKYYVQNGVGGAINDITPIRKTSTTGVSIHANIGLAELRITDTAHGVVAGDFVILSGAVGLGGAFTSDVLNVEHRVYSVIDLNNFVVVMPVVSTGADTGSGGSSITCAYELSMGEQRYITRNGWGAGGFGAGGWGQSSGTGAVGVQMRLWSQANFGEDLIFCLRGGSIYYWANNANPGIFTRGQLLAPSVPINTKAGTATPDETTPTVASFVLVSDASRFVFAFGCNDPTGVYATQEQDPMQLRWSDQGLFGVWATSITNQAGGIRFSNGSQLVTAVQTRQEILVFTDTTLYAIQHLGAPYVWGSQLLGDNISVMSPNAVATVNNVTYWMGVDKFYMYAGRVETLPCALRAHVFGNMNKEQAYHVFAGTNEGYNEVWWVYCAENSTLGDRYVVYNHLERTWYYGTFDGTTTRARTAWLDSPLRAGPTVAVADQAAPVGDSTSVSSNNGLLVYHEVGVDNAETNDPVPIDAYIQSSDIDIEDGHSFGFVWRLVPDVTFDGSVSDKPAVSFTLQPRRSSGAEYTSAQVPTVTSPYDFRTQHTYAVQQFTQQVYIRVRGRQMALRVSSNMLGVQWQLGAPSIDVRPDGRR